jgi:L-lactate dehydrogenase complex protein LldG
MSLVEEFAANAVVAGFTVHRGQAPAIEGAGISRAAYGLAATGSVVLLASPEEPRARSLLPSVHVALGGSLPSSVAIITGPSRSADIEQRLTIGVHGPGEVHVVLLPDDG